MTKEQIETLKKGDIITWQRDGKDWNAYGRIARDVPFGI